MNKHKMISCFSIIVFKLLLIGCGNSVDTPEPTYAPQPFGLQFGSTRSDVISKLGSPAETDEDIILGHCYDDYYYENSYEARPEHFHSAGTIPADDNSITLHLEYTLPDEKESLDDAILTYIRYEEYGQAPTEKMNQAVEDFASYLKSFYGDYEKDDIFYEWEIIRDELSIDVSLAEAEEEDNSIWYTTSIYPEGINSRANTCYACGQELNDNDFYTISTDYGTVYLCPNCRNELLLNKGFIIVNNEKIYPFADSTIFKDGLLTCSLPNGYELTKSDDIGYVFHKVAEDEDHVLLILTDDIYRDSDLELDREDFDMDFVFYLAVENEATDSFYEDFNYHAEHEYEVDNDYSGDSYRLTYRYDDGCIYIVTIKDGIKYVIGCNSNTDPIFNYLDALSVTIFYPSIEQIDTFYNGTK